MTLKGTELAKVRVMDTMQKEITALEGQLESLTYNYERWRNVVSQTTLQAQHQMMEGDLQTGMEILDLVQEEPQRLLMAIEEDLSQRGAVETAMM